YANAGSGADRLSRLSLRDDVAGVRRLRDSSDHPNGEALIALLVALLELKAVGQVFDRITVEIDLDLVGPFGVEARCRNRSRDRVADVDDERGAGLATEHVEVGDIESYVLPSDRRVEVMRHGASLARSDLAIARA